MDILQLLLDLLKTDLCILIKFMFHALDVSFGFYLNMVSLNISSPFWIYAHIFYVLLDECIVSCYHYYQIEYLPLEQHSLIHYHHR